MLWLDDLAGWSGAVPAALVRRDCSREMGRDLLRAMAVRALGRPPDDVAILHRPGHGPRLAEPDSTDGMPALALSLASRGRLSVIAVAAGPIGVDVELVDPAGEVPWAVLHPKERSYLADLSDAERPAAFARLWTLKEAYLKALRWGLARDPAGFAVAFLDESAAHIGDPGGVRAVQAATTIWRSVDGDVAAISAVLLAPEPAATG
jgi:phosphopantetheinyl transferase